MKESALLQAMSVCFLLMISASVCAQDSHLSPAEVEARFIQRINEAKKELSKLHDKQAAEREALVQNLGSLRSSVNSIRKEVEYTEHQVAAARNQLSSVQEDANSKENLTTFTSTLLVDYRRALETRIGASEQQHHEESLRAVDKILANKHHQKRIPAAQELLQLSEQLLEWRWGAQEHPGQALDKEGNVCSGHFLEIGPVAYFREDNGELTGVVSHRLGSSLPTVLTDEDCKANISSKKLSVEPDEMLVPIDVTLGNAGKLAESHESWFEHIRKGGITIVPLLILAITCSILTVWKILSLFALREVNASSTACETKVRAIVNALSGGDTNEATALAADLPEPVGPVIEEGVRYHTACLDTIEEIMSERLLAQVPRLERFLTPLAVCATAAPLLGLLGTVTGMIHTFRLITVFGTGDARLLSSGISEALITTEFGLLIAIPALLIHAWLSRRVRDIVAATQQAAILFVNAIKLTPGKPENNDAEGTAP